MILDIRYLRISAKIRVPKKIILMKQSLASTPSTLFGVARVLRVFTKRQIFISLIKH